MGVTAAVTGASPRPRWDWHGVNWRRVHRNVRRLQARIAKATKEGKWRKVRALQIILTRSLSGRFLAVRRVTENRGKRTPGIDREIRDTPEKKSEALHRLRRAGYRAQPLRRTYIPKGHDQSKKRPLGIPTMRDRAMQALHLLALEPIAETRADCCSYGFRRGRPGGSARRPTRSSTPSWCWRNAPAHSGF